MGDNTIGKTTIIGGAPQVISGVGPAQDVWPPPQNPGNGQGGGGGGGGGISPGLPGQVLTTDPVPATQWQFPSMVSVANFLGPGESFAVNSQPAFQRAFDALSGTGIALWIPGGNYVFTLGVTPRSNLVVWGSPNARLIANLAAGPFSLNTILFYGANALAPGIALTADVAPGDQIINLTSSATINVGDTLALSTDLVTYWQLQQFIVIAKTPTTITLDRATQLPWLAAGAGSATAQVVTGTLTEFHWYGNGMTISGTVQRYFELVGAYRCSISDVHVDDVNGQANDYCLSWDEGSRECIFYRVTIHQDVPTLALELTDRCFDVECQVYGKKTAAGTQAGFLLDDCLNSAVIDSSAFDVHGAGVLLASEAANPGCINCTVKGGLYCGNQVGVQVTVTNGTLIHDVTCRGNLKGLLVSNTTGTVLSAVRAQYNTQWGIECSGNVVQLENCDVGFNTNVGLLVNSGKVFINGLRSDGGNAVFSGSFFGVIATVGATLVDLRGADWTVDAGVFGMYAQSASGHVIVRDSSVVLGAGAVAFADAVAGSTAVFDLDNTVEITGAPGTSAIVTVAGGTSTWRRKGLRTILTQTLVAGTFSDIGQVAITGAVPVVVPWPDLQPNDRVQMTMNTPTFAGAQTFAAVAYTPGTGFTVTGFAGDTSVYDYEIG